MSEGADALKLVVVAVHATGWDRRAAEGFRYGLTEVVRRIEKRLRVKHPAVEVQAKFLDSDQAGDVQEWRSVCTIAVLDASEMNEKLALQAGRLFGGGVPVILVGDMECEHIVARRPNWGIPELVLYRSVVELFQPESTFETELFRAIPEARIQEELIYRVWFPRETSTIWVVCPQDHTPSEYADRSSLDYTYLDNLGDQDALLELMVFLSRHYPNATIRHFNSGDLPDGHTGGSLVVVGGPGSTSDIGNSVCAEMMEAIRSRVSYSKDCDQMKVVTEKGAAMVLRAEFRDESAGGIVTQRRIREDRGYFARFPNPLNVESTVVLVNGIHTTGVLGAARAFSERREALPNFHTVLRAGASTTGFECYFKVRVLSGNVRVPSVEVEDVFGISWRVSATTGRPEEPARKTDGRDSVTILFIAGDRGGSHLNEIQIPKEFHAIQEALLASEHREFIALGTPILAATRERLAHAYRSAPQIVHYVGHGNERSLSIIEDNCLLANGTALDAEEFGTVLGMMKERVMLCVLNACESGGLAGDLVGAGVVEYAVGWPCKVSDSTAIAFTSALYGAVGDGRTMQEAFDIAKSACGPKAVPVLMRGEGAGQGPLVVGGEEDR